MLKNYLTVALRALRRNSTYTVVNVVGLALGMACCALILVLVYHEWSYDQFHENADNIHRTYFQWQNPEGEKSYQSMMRPEFTEEIRTESPQVLRASTYVASFQNLEFGDQISS